MTPGAMQETLDKYLSRRYRLLESVEKAARAVVPVLLDSGRANSAKELQELLFEFDAMEQEMKALVSQNLGAAMLATLEILKKKP